MRTKVILTADCVAGREGEDKNIRTSELFRIEGCYKEVKEAKEVSNKAILSPKTTK